MHMQLKYATDWTKTVEVWQKQKQKQTNKQKNVKLKHMELAKLRGWWRDADPLLMVHLGVGQTKEVRNMFII